ncbi:hypothetical protein PENVUL_c011G07828 [Penicillium vulpinum]|uniref:Uncharacterized protein n=2 Tax=Penicillium vulpinum TaxID=29845 RepID=A0A1V6S1U1_9EURO|nr:hypothetical protein PENVUL_c011G07828 [Penicillium vulpinum]
MLPIEIRLIIWEYLISSIHTQSSPLKDSSQKDNPLSILSTSRYLYNEISSHLFNKSAQIISLDAEYHPKEWMIIQLKSRTVDVQWTLKNREDAEMHFQNFPNSKTTLKVHIYSPDPTDPGQLVLIWQKVNALVDFLIPMKLLIPMTQPNIELVIKGSWNSTEPPAYWRRNRDLFYEMGGLQQSIEPMFKYRCDYDIAVLPFLRLELWNEDPAANIPAMPDDEFDILHWRLMSLFEQTGIERRLGRLFSMTQDTAVIEIKSALAEANMFLETSLDELPGRTACLLRLERFQNWFEDGTSWKSLYETELRDQLCACPWVTMDTDPWLYRSNERYINLILLHHAMHARRSKLPDAYGVYHQTIYEKWDSAMWSEEFPDGIPRLGDVQRSLRRKNWSEAFQYKITHAYVDWLAQRRAKQIESEESKESKCPFIHRSTLWGH